MAIMVRNGPRVRNIEGFKAETPSVILIDPKYGHNVGMVVRLACAYGLRQVWFTGNRVLLDSEEERIPREERMRDYAEISVVHHERPFDLMHGATFVAVEFVDNAENLPQFEHPNSAVYVFGPEDGSLGRLTMQHCHRFVRLPTRHCLNLATAVATVLYDRTAKN